MRGKGKMDIADVSWMSSTTLLYGHQYNIYSYLKEGIVKLGLRLKGLGLI